MDLERARAGMLSLSLAFVLGGFGCADQPETPPADDVPTTPAPVQEMEPEPAEGSGAETPDSSASAAEGS